jgi:hypothetical protein
MTTGAAAAAVEASAAALAPSATLPIATALARPVHTAVVVEEVAAAAAVILTIRTTKTTRMRSAPREPSPTAGSLVTLSGQRSARLTLLRLSANAQLQAKQRLPQAEAAQRKFCAWFQLDFTQHAHKVTDLPMTPSCRTRMMSSQPVRALHKEQRSFPERP